MHRFWRTIALSVLVSFLASLDWVLWFSMHLLFGVDSMNLELSHDLIPWFILIRGFITVVFVWAFTYLNTHSVIATREENTRIVTKG